MAYNLPGVNVVVKDGGLIIPQTSTTESMLIIAESLLADAPVEPVLVRTSNDLAANGFGGFYVGSQINPIAAEWLAASNAGCRTIYLASLKEASVAGFPSSDVSETAKRVRKFMYLHNLLTNTLADFSVDHIVVKGVTSGDLVKELTEDMFADYLGDRSYPNLEGLLVSAYVVESNDITLPLTVTASSADSLVVGANTIHLTPGTYDGTIGKGLTDLAADINAKMASASPAAVAGKVVAVDKKLVFYFEQTSAALTSTITALNAAVAGKVPVLKRTTEGNLGVGSFGKLIGDYCANQTLQHNACVGYIAAPSAAQTTIAAIRDHVDELLANDIRVSEYTQTFAEEVAMTIPGTNAVYYMNGVTQYAAFVSTLPVQSGTTNKVLPGIIGPRFEYSPRQLASLTEKGYVTLRRKNGRLTVTEGVTSAPYITVANVTRPSDFTKLSTLRTIQKTVQMVREATDPFIGEANELPQYNALNTAIKSTLVKLQENRVIQDFSFAVIARANTLDEAIVTLRIVPMYELRAVQVDMSLTTAI